MVAIFQASVGEEHQRKEMIGVASTRLSRSKDDRVFCSCNLGIRIQTVFFLLGSGLRSSSAGCFTDPGLAGGTVVGFTARGRRTSGGDHNLEEVGTGMTSSKASLSNGSKSGTLMIARHARHSSPSRARACLAQAFRSAIDVVP